MDFKKLFAPKQANIRKSKKNFLYKDLSFSAIEQYKLLRANLLFTLPDDEGSHVIGVTSSVRNEGKSTTSINIAYTLAEAGKRVLLIDADMRLPSVAKKTGWKSEYGLSQAIMDFDGTKAPPYIEVEGYSRFSVLLTGPLPPNPSELLASKRMERLIEFFKTQFEYIIIDLPPVNIVSDAIAVSPFISGMVLVVREDITEKKELNACARQLMLSGVKVLGTVLNCSKYGKSGLNRHKYGSDYDYRYYAKPEAKKEPEALWTTKKNSKSK